MGRFTAEEKGKKIDNNTTDPPRVRIKAPDFDPAELIQENSLTLVGRLTNPKEQQMSSVLPNLPKLWNMVGRTSGSDLGNNCFQFRFDNETDLRTVLKERPYQFGRWMLIIQRWEPIISATFPSQIPFWISLKGIPLHFWHEKVVKNLGMEIGTLEDYSVTKSAARVCVTIDGLKPLLKEFIMEFKSGEESLITMEYDKLGNHCSICNRLSHLRFHCPERLIEAPSSLPTHRQTPTQDAPLQRGVEKSERTENISIGTHQQAFHQRFDRHGRPFGERVSSLLPKAQGLKNKITPATERTEYYQDTNRDREVMDKGGPQLPIQRETSSPRRRTQSPQGRLSNQQQDTGHDIRKEALPPIPSSPPFSTLRQNRRHSESYGKRKRQIFPSLEKVGKSTDVQGTSPPLHQELQDLQRSHSTQINALPNGGQLPTALPTPGIPTTEEVMNELREATYRYTNVSDPKESEARRQRVLDGEMENLMAVTAANIIAAAAKAQQDRERAAATLRSFSTLNQVKDNPVIPSPQATNEIILLPDATTAPLQKKRGRPPLRKKHNPSPRHLTGANSRKVNLSKTQTTPAGPSRRRTTPTSQVSTPQAPRPARHRQNRTTSPHQDEPEVDFHHGPPPLP